MRKIITLGIIGVGVIACTVIALLMIFTTYGKLFYLNLSAIIIAELILISSVPILNHQSLLTFKKAATTNLLLIYAVIAVLWTTIYSLCIESDNEINNIFIGLCILTGIFILLIGFTELGSNAMEERHQKQLSDEERRREFIVPIMESWQQISVKLPENLKEEKPVILLKQITDRLTILTSSHFRGERDKELTEIQKTMEKIKENLLNLEDDCHQIPNEIAQLINQLKLKVDNIK